MRRVIADPAERRVAGIFRTLSSRDASFFTKGSKDAVIKADEGHPRKRAESKMVLPVSRPNKGLDSVRIGRRTTLRRSISAPEDVLSK